MEHPIIITSKGKIGRRDKRQSIYNNVISNYLSTPQGRQSLAASMVQPIRRSLNYQGIARQALQVQQLPQGALPYYSKEPEGYKHDAIKITSKGEVCKKGSWKYLRGQRVVVPQFEIFANPTIRIADVKTRRFNLIDRAVHKAKAVIMAQEDSMIFEALDKLGSENGSSNN
jgi:hypothetical protein